MNPNPTEARKAKRARRKTPDMQALLLKLWSGVEAAESMLNNEDEALRLKAVHGLATVGGAYARAYEVGELEADVRELQAQMKVLTGADSGAA